MTKETIGLIFVAISLVILLLPIIFGAIRGKKQSGFRLVWLLVTGVIAFLLAMLVAKVILDMVKIGGKTIPEFVLAEIESSDAQIAQMMQDNPEFAQLIAELCSEASMAVVRLVAFALIYWLLKWLLFPVWKIIAVKRFSRKKKVNGQITLEDGTIVPAMQPKPQKRGVLMGAVFGLIIGIFTLIITFVPVASINSLVLAIDEQTQSQNAEGEATPGLISNMLGENATYLTSFSDSPAGKVMKATGLDAIEVFLGNGLTKMNIGGQSTGLFEEVKSLAPIAKDVMELKKYNFSALSSQDASQVLLTAKDLCGRLFDSKIAENLYGALRNYMIDGITSDGEFWFKLPSLGSPEYDKIANLAVLQIKEISFADLKNDVIGVLSLFDELNQKSNIVVDFFGGMKFEKLQNDLTVEAGKQIVTSFANLNLTSHIVKVVAEPLVQSICEWFDDIEYDGKLVNIEYVKNPNELTVEAVKQTLQNLLPDAIAILQGISTDSAHFAPNGSLKFSITKDGTSQDLYIDKNILQNLGGIVDTIKNAQIISQQTFESAINYAQTTIKIFAEKSLSSQFEKIKPAIAKVVDSLKDLSSFATELKYFADALKVLPENLQITPAIFAKIADKLAPSYIYTHFVKAGRNGNADSKALYDSLNDFALDFVNTNFSSIVTLTLDDVQKLTDKIMTIESFETEIGEISDILDFFDSKSAEQIKQTQNLKQLGAYLDLAKNQSKLVDDEICKLVIAKMIDSAQIPADFADVQIDGAPIKDALKTNVEKIESYEIELECVGKVLNADTNSFSTIAQYGSLLDSIAQSKLFDGTINAIIVNQFDKYSADFADFEQVFLLIKANVSNLARDYQTQLAYLDLFKDFATSSEEKTIANTKTFIRTNLVDASGHAKGILIDDNVLFEIADTAVDNAKFDDKSIDEFGNLKNDLKANLQASKDASITIVTIFDQLDALQQYYQTELSAGFEVNETTTKAQMAGYGAKIDGLKAGAFANILDTKAVNDIGKYMIDQINSSVQTSTSLFVTTEKKQRVQSTVDAIDYQNNVGYSALLEAIATDLELA